MHAASTSASAGAIRLIALFEAFKGAVVLLAGTGLLSLLHQDIHALAERLVQHAHLNPASHYPRIFLDAAAHVSDARLLWLAAGAALYAALRLLEAYGLWRNRAWAEVLAALSGGVYLPLELMEFLRAPSALHAAILLANAAVVAVMVRALLQRRRQRH